MYGGVQLKDYEGMAGFGMNPFGQTEDVQKALSAGYQNPGQMGGGALRMESLEATLRIVTFTQANIKLWRQLPKLPAFSTVEEYTIQTNYGGDQGIFTREGELPQASDASYERKAAQVKFMGVQKEITHPQMLVRPAHGSVLALETQNGAVALLEQIERKLFTGRSDVIPEEFDGLFKQITDDPQAAAQNVLDMRGGPLTEDALEEMANIIIESYGVPTDLYLAPRALSDVAKQFYPRERVNLPAAIDGKVGLAVSAMQTNAGLIQFQNDVFLRSGKNNGIKVAPASATSARSPSAPTVAAANNPGPVTGSKWRASDAGAYFWRVTAVNRFGESAPGNSASVTMAATDSATLTITDGGGTDTATGYNIYRTAASGAVGTAQFMIAVPRIAGAATTTFVDLNLNLPGTSNAFMLQMNLQNLSFRQLAPMIKIPLATLAASIRWMQLLYGTPIVYSPRRNGIFVNVLDD